MMPQGNVACVCFLNAATVLFVNRQLALSTLSSRNCSEEWAAQEEAFRALPRPECRPPAERSQRVIPGPVWFDALNNKLHSMWGISKWNKGKFCRLWPSWWPAPNRDWAKRANYPRHLMTSVILPPDRPDSMASQSSQPPSPLVGSSWGPTAIEKPGRTARWMHPRHQNSWGSLAASL